MTADQACIQISSRKRSDSFIAYGKVLFKLNYKVALLKTIHKTHTSKQKTAT